MLCRTNGFRLEQDSRKENMSDKRTYTGSLVPFAIVITNQPNSHTHKKKKKHRKCKENGRKEVWLQLKCLYKG